MAVNASPQSLHVGSATGLMSASRVPGSHRARCERHSMMPSDN